MPTHLVFKLSAYDAYDYFIDTYVDCRRFVCEETGASEDNLHRHVYYDGEFPNIEALRKKLNKHRATPTTGNVSIKQWDKDITYFCKGSCPITPPKIILNEMGIDEESILAKQVAWWSHPSKQVTKCKDKVSVMDLLIIKCKSDIRWPDLTAERVAFHWADIYIEAGLKRTLGSKFQMENQIKTILLFMDPVKYKKILLEQSKFIFR